VSQGDALAGRAWREWIRQFPIAALTYLRMKKTSQRRNFDYSVTTKGGETAAKVRAEANRLSESEREILFKKGMQMIDGGIVKE
jgi:hypothetical protein